MFMVAVLLFLFLYPQLQSATSIRETVMRIVGEYGGEGLGVQLHSQQEFLWEQNLSKFSRIVARGARACVTSQHGGYFVSRSRSYSSDTAEKSFLKLSDHSLLSLPFHSSDTTIQEPLFGYLYFTIPQWSSRPTYSTPLEFSR